MAKFNFKGLAKIVGETVTKHSPEILTGIGIAGMVTTTVLAVKATPKALQLVNSEIARINRELIKEAADHGDENCNQINSLSAVDTIKMTWKCYIPAAITGALSISCLIGASSVSLKRNAVLATAYKLSETALSEYKDAVIETIGEKKEQAVREKVAENRLANDPVSTKEVIITGKGTTLCYDYHSGSYFESDIETIRRAQNNLNKEMLSNDYVSLNDFYDELDRPHTSLGDDLGWKVENGLIEISFTSKIADDGRPCIVINYNIAPKRDYYKFA